MCLTPADESDDATQPMAFCRFLVSHRKRLESIARATRGEFQLQDLHGEAWLMAGEIHRLRGVQINFLDPEFQNLLLAYLYKHCVDFREQKLRHAQRLDESRREADGDDLPARIESMPASEFSDPMLELIEHEAEQAAPHRHGTTARPRHTYICKTVAIAACSGLRIFCTFLSLGATGAMTARCAVPTVCPWTSEQRGENRILP